MWLCGTLAAYSQSWEDPEISKWIQSLKKDPRGPYKDIRWFCTDGSIRQPRDPCPEEIGPGVQHARYKDEVISLMKARHLYFGQILAYTDHNAFWDAEQNHARLKQYQIEKYLKSVDEGWILQKGQYYRGAVQAEDEEAWGIDFYHWLLAKDEALSANFFLIRQSLRDVPHSGDDDVAQLMRSQSKVLSDSYAPFMELRIKIHGQPESKDIGQVESFRKQHQNQLSDLQKNQFNELLKTMKRFHKPVELASLKRYSAGLTDPELRTSIEQFASNKELESVPSKLVTEASGLLWQIRENILSEKKASARLQLLDASVKLEELIYRYAVEWDPSDLRSLMEKICYLGMAAAGAGFVENWEWEELASVLTKYDMDEISLGQLNEFLQRARSQVEWSAAMVRAHYEKEVEDYSGFEPLAAGFIDAKIRGSVALHLGMNVAELGDFFAVESAITNQVLNLNNQSSIRGLNPGYAMGELVVVSELAEKQEVSADKIYVFMKPPSDLKPVAGIATVSEGNLVSHVQLLARNLGIPNAALSSENLNQLRKYQGQKIFYAVSNHGNVLMKPADQMSAAERALFANKTPRNEGVEIAVDQINLNIQTVLDMRAVSAEDSGKLCGPKAANLAQLKKMFPDNVVEGLVIPFGVFKSHMDQLMPGKQISYWSFLNEIFQEANRMRANEVPEQQVDEFQLKELNELRQAIQSMPLENAFVQDLQDSFKNVFGDELGKVPVFLRSDTNMEDLKDFTGAGLNLTLFNVLDREKIINGIRSVWASPYTERSFKWRQKFLLNPENVFPSILVIPSVNVDYSGVLITKGILSNQEQDLTIAFSRGAGGAVEGQAAESYLVYANGTRMLLAPSREISYNSLPPTGGTAKNYATFENPILNQNNINQIIKLADIIRDRVPRETHTDYDGAYDVELGFKDDKLWLFQIRPFVENKKALSSEYLESISPKKDLHKKIDMTKSL